MILVWLPGILQDTMITRAIHRATHESKLLEINAVYFQMKNKMMLATNCLKCKGVVDCAVNLCWHFGFAAIERRSLNCN